jgi:hypothetical protein
MNGGVVNKTLLYIAVLAGLLIVAVYFIGFATDSGAVLSGVNSLILSLTGRTQNGTFAAYPGGTTTLAGASSQAA